jgi:hypothetical protein
VSETERARGNKYLGEVHRPIRRSDSPPLLPSVYTSSSLILRPVVTFNPSFVMASPSQSTLPKQETHEVPDTLPANEEPVIEMFS